MELKTVEKLISLIRDRPTIYGPRPKRGKKKHQRILDELWKEVALQMNRSVRECKLKWTTLRNCYARLLREERLHKVKKRHWHLRNEMSFLRGHIQPYTEVRGITHKRTASVRTKLPPDSLSTTNNSFDENNFSPTIDQLQPNETSAHSSKTIENSTIVHDFLIVDHNNEQSLNNNNWEQEQEQLPIPAEGNETINYCPTINLNPFSLTERIIETPEENSQLSKYKEERSEANMLFLRSLLPDINKLSDRKQRIFKRKTLEVLELLFDEDEFDVSRDDNLHVRQCQIPRSNYSVQQNLNHSAIGSEKFVQKVEPTSP
ncbi:uncharacterized protein LOC129946746 isoform X1 [Eupeodes corollae]|uniref:uncharacterized protein LOC129946746 isoform X1 n=2 Tax=Eupeodes corollae TaxID=290404 RepID=UPI00248F730A|nr:uncharacterized protein LOC129946746 isoform X1 [Eupeodes corollae]